MQRHDKVLEAEADQMRTMKLEGKTYTAIARTFHRSYVTVRMHIDPIAKKNAYIKQSRRDKKVKDKLRAIRKAVRMGMWTPGNTV